MKKGDTDQGEDEDSQDSVPLVEQFTGVGIKVRQAPLCVLLRAFVIYELIMIIVLFRCFCDFSKFE